MAHNDNVGKPLNQYDLPLDADPDAVDVEFDLPEDYDPEVQELEDGGALVGDFSLEEGELPPFESAPHNSNLVAYLDEDDLSVMAKDLVEAWRADDDSRSDWKETYKNGLELLGMKTEPKEEPFKGASGVHHPLLAEAVVQFQAQAYKEILPPGGPVLTKVLGSKSPERVAQANRVQSYMNYQIVEVMEEYDPNLDQLLFYLPLGGSAFKKTYFDPAKNRACSMFVKAENLTVPYGTTDLLSATRITHDFILSGNDLLKYQQSGWYSEEHQPESIQTGSQDEIKDQTDEMEGISGGYYQHDENYEMIEVHTNLDLDNLASDNDDIEISDRVAKPYVVTIDPEAEVVMSIRRNYEEGDEQAKRLEYFTHYKFLPGLGFYGYGLIHLIGGLTSSVTTILRSLVNAGMFANHPAGLKSKGIRIEGDDEPLAPGEFRDVDVPNGNIKEAIMPMPFKEPSQVLFALLGTLVESGQRFASIADMQVGDTSGQQQPVGTTVAMLERGTKVMSAIHKRIHYAQKGEFKILVRLIKNSMSSGMYPYAVEGEDKFILQEDFDDRVDVLPVSDPNIFSMAQRVMIASQQLQMAQAAPDIHDLREAYRRMYVAMGINDIESLLKPEEKPEPYSPVAENRRVLENKKLNAMEEMNHEAHIEAHIMFLQTPYVMSRMEFAANLVQDIMNHITMLAKQMAQQQGGDPVSIELQMLKSVMPRLAPPKGKEIEALQAQQLAEDERKHKEDEKINREELAAKERMAQEKNDITLIVADKKAQGSK